MMPHRPGKAVASVALAGAMAWGHHAMEYIEMESFSTPRQGEAVFHLHYDYCVDDGDNSRLDHWEFTPGVSYGLLNGLMVGIHTHLAKFGPDHLVEEQRPKFEPGGPSPFMEATAVSLQGRLPFSGPVDTACVLRWEVPFRRAKQLLGSEDHAVAATLILSRDFRTHGNLCANLSWERDGDEEEWAWALGAKTPISHDPHGIAVGVEIMGDLQGDAWSVLPGVYAPINEMLILKTGLELGQSKNQEDQWADTLRVNVTLMYRF